MKHCFIVLLAVVVSLNLFAQEQQLQKGNFVIDVKTTLGDIGGDGGAGTGMVFTAAEDIVIWNIGAEMGYFVNDGIAIKAGLGFGSFDGSSILSYKLGGKFYAANNWPLQFDLMGNIGEDIFGENTVYLGFQGGYAFFIGDLISIEPAMRYNLSMAEGPSSFFQITTGLSIFF